MSQSTLNERTAKLDHYLQNQMKKTGNQVRLIDLFTCCMKLFAGMLAALFLLALIDGWIFELSGWARWAALVLLLGGGLAYIVLAIVPLMIRKINPVYAAKVVESSQPDMKNSLINYLLLRQQTGRVSRRVVEIVGSKAANDISGVPVENTVDKSHTIKAALILTALVILLGAYKVFSPKDPFQTFARILAPASDISKPASVSISDVNPGDTEVFFGQELKISARIKGNFDSDTARVVFTTDDNQIVDGAIRMEGDEFSNWHCVLKTGDRGIEQSLRYRIVAGDGVSNEYKVTMTTSPILTVESISYEPADYMELSDNTEHGVTTIKHYEGTQVTVNAVANADIKTCYMQLLREDGGNYIPVNKVSMEKIGPRKASGKLNLRLNANRNGQSYTHYQLHLVTEDGGRSRSVAANRIIVNPDMAPTIFVDEPQEAELEVPANSRIRFVIEAHDVDFKLSEIAIATDTDTRRLGQLPIDMGDQNLAQPVKVTYEWWPKKLMLKAGETAYVQFAAYDNRQPEENMTISGQYTIRIVQPVENPPKENKGNENQSDDSNENDSDDQGEKGDNGENAETGDSQEAGSGGDGDANESGDENSDANSESGGAENKGSDSGQGNSGNASDSSQDSNADNQSDQDADGNQSGTGSEDGTPESGSQGQEGDQDNTGKTGQASEQTSESGGTDTGDNADPNSAQSSDSTGNSSQSDSREQSGQSSNNEPSDGGSRGSSNSERLSEDAHDSDVFEEAMKHREQQEKEGTPGQQDQPDDGQEQNGNESGSGSQDEQNSGNESQQNQSQSGQAKDGSESAGDSQSSSNNDAGEKKGSQGQESESGSGNQSQENNGEQNADQGSGQTPDQSSSADSPQTDDNSVDQKGEADAQSNNEGSAEESAGESGESKEGENSGQSSGDESEDQQNESSGGGNQDESKENEEKSGGGGGDQQEKQPGGSGDQQDSDSGQSGNSEKSGQSGDGPSGEGSADSQSDSQSSEPGDGSPGESKNGSGDQGKPNGDDPSGKSGASSDQGSGQGADEMPERNDGADGSESKDKSGNQGQQSDKGKNESKGQKGGGDESGGKQPGGNSGSSESKSGDQKQPGKGEPSGGGGNQKDQQSGQSSDEPSGGDNPGNGSSSSSSSSSPGGTDQPIGEASQADKANLEHTKKATDLALEYLEDKVVNPDPKLLDRLNFTEEELADFVARWKELRKQAASGDEQDRLEYERALESLDIGESRASQRQFQGQKDDREGYREDGRVDGPPPGFADRMKAFSRKRNRARDK